MTTLTQTMIEPFHRQITMNIFFQAIVFFLLPYNRSTWQRVSAVRLFIEHTCPGSSACHRADDVNAFKLWKVRINLFYPSPSLGTRLGENRRHRGTVVFRRCILAGDFKLN